MRDGADDFQILDFAFEPAWLHERRKLRVVRKALGAVRRLSPKVSGHCCRLTVVLAAISSSDQS